MEAYRLAAPFCIVLNLGSDELAPLLFLRFIISVNYESGSSSMSMSSTSTEEILPDVPNEAIFYFMNY